MKIRVACFTVTVCLLGCSAQIEQLAAPMSVVQVDDNVYRLEESVTIKATHAAPVVLQENTVWTKIGTIEHGNVFDTKDQVVIVNSFDVHEAAVVIRDGYVVGFYLKAKQTYVSANPVAISLSEGESAHANP